MVVIALKLAASAAASIAAGTLTFASVRNAVETISICSNHPSNQNTNAISPARALTESDSGSFFAPSTGPILGKYITSDGTALSIATEEKSVDEIIQDLKQLKRRELLTIFLHCDSPEDVNMIKGKWDGYLLDNNSVLVRNRRREQPHFK